MNNLVLIYHWIFLSDTGRARGQGKCGTCECDTTCALCLSVLRRAREGANSDEHMPSISPSPYVYPTVAAGPSYGRDRVLLPWSAFRRFLLLRSPTSCTVSYSRDKLRSIFDIMRVKWVKIPFATRFY